MKLPHMKYGDNITKQTQIAFGGYNHSPNAKDGEIYDMQNVSSDLYPLITQRKKRDNVSGVSSYLFKGKEFWMGNLNGQGEIFINIDIANKLVSGDVIKIDVSGELSANSGSYIVVSASNTYSGGYIHIGLQGTFTKENSEKRPTEDNAKLPTNKGELSIRLYQYVNSTGSREITYQLEEVKSDTTEYTLEDERFIVKTTNIESEFGYGKNEKVTVKKITYSDTPTVSDSGMIIGGASNFYFFSNLGNNYLNYGYENYKITAVDVSGNKYWGYIEGAGTNLDQVYMSFYDNNFPDVWQEEISLSEIYLYEPKLEEVPTDDNDDNKDVVWTDTKEEGEDLSEFDVDNLTITETTTEWTDLYKITTTITNTVYELKNHYLDILSINADENLYFVTNNGDFYYDGIYRGTLSAGDKQFAQTGAFLYILPDNVFYNTITGTITKKTSKYLRGYNYGVSFDGNFIDTESDLSMFKAGDVVTIIANSATKGKYEFKNVTIRTINATEHSKFTDWSLGFSENIIEKAGYTLNDIVEDNWGWSSITITKGVPALKYICADANRIWGCDEKTIYCTSFGNPLGWYEYDASQAGNDADIAWTIEPFDSEGDFTGCCIYNDRPMFFKENKIYKVYGSKASDFQLSSEDTPGVSKGSSESICIIDSVLYYLSPEGVMRYSGNYGTCISDEFYESFENAVGGSDGTHYYITMQSGDEWKTFTYNTKKRLWCIEDDKRVKRYFDFERNVFRHDFDGQIQCINPSSAEYPELFENVTRENDFESFVEFGDFYVDVLNKKAPSKLNFRFLVEDGNVEILINYDSEEADGERVWNSVKTIQSDKKKSIIVPMIPKRCDHYRIKIKGSGKWTLYAMSYEYYVGTEL